ncbi:hypothetical protein K469DRAFT_693386 [Zopfia rhizophila CBS 207.26]|uniref:Uncharacterized protein n=1 Tax=Zopfia rhizophila CBS 207.26 TaxID=1314779 RepID=A0A6A6DPT0_9PEZI|nr:hypothetical protein K469DRAFT_693386 [Zopfia rhizophila CBS 207.26]
MTFASWLDTVTLPTTRFLLDVFSKVIFAAESSELSLLYVLSYIAAAANETNSGTIARLTGITNAAQAKRVVGGTGLIASKLAEKIGYERIALNTSAQSITKTCSG